MAPLVGALAAALLAPRADTSHGRMDAAASVFALFVLGRIDQEKGDDLSTASDLRTKPRSISIVTTASLPWMTGTAVNPLLRAIFLARDGHNITLVMPWVSSRDSQSLIFGHDNFFISSDMQRTFIQSWLIGQGFGDVQIRMIFYEAVFSSKLGSILPLGAITDVFSTVSDLERDVCILEEPEHLSWHHPGEPWPEMFRVVIGVIHTNYVEYARSFGFFGPQRAILIMLLTIWVCRSYCHRVIKLSDAVQHFPHSVTCNVHGVRDRFIDIGRTQAIPRDRGAYFMAKVLWRKGYAELIDLLCDHFRRTGHELAVDFFGDGKEAPEVADRIAREPGLARVRFAREYANHSSEQMQRYRVFVNASVSEVVCTATAEALAMGKIVVCVEHPSNDFFATFPNCYTYRTPKQFSETFMAALERKPVPLSEYDAYRLSWTAATHRFYDAAKVPHGERRPGKVDEVLANAHSAISKLYPNPGENILKKQIGMRLLDANEITSEAPHRRPINIEASPDDARSEESVSFSDVSDVLSTT